MFIFELMLVIGLLWLAYRLADGMQQKEEEEEEQEAPEEQEQEQEPDQELDDMEALLRAGF